MEIFGVCCPQTLSEWRAGPDLLSLTVRYSPPFTYRDGHAEMPELPPSLPTFGYESSSVPSLKIVVSWVFLFQ